MRGAATWVHGAAVSPTRASSLTSGGSRSPQRCIFSAMASSLRCTTNSFVRTILAAVSFSAPSPRRLTLIITIGGSSPSMLNIENGAALAVPSGPSVVTSAMGRGTIRLAMSL
ncbi:hypothetical protein D3C86_1636690 [compost metagenome]